MKRLHTLALDAMGGDFGPEVVVPAAIATVRRRDDLQLILVGDESVLTPMLGQKGRARADRIHIQHASEQVAMDDPPSAALRTKKDSSMRVAINLVKEGHADACVSAGNTGALMAIAKFVLKTLPGIDRPAICTALPTPNGLVHVLDLGANVECTPEHLFQFAVMGSVLVGAVERKAEPSVALLNVGAEAIKGNEIVKAASQLLAGSDLNYAGFVEGDDIYAGSVDVIVSDGFVGNVALKTSEGLAKMIGGMLKEEFLRTPLTRLMGLCAMPVLKAFRRRIDPRRYNGASLLGLNGIVIKSHGGADTLAFENAIKIAMLEVEQAVPQRISRLLESHLHSEATA
jgi:glycerol-3-phosphate acyltransferase PlsX